MPSDAPPFSPAVNGSTWSASSARSGSSRMAAAHCCELLQVLRSIPATRLPGDPAAAETRLTCGA